MNAKDQLTKCQKERQYWPLTNPIEMSTMKAQFQFFFAYVFYYTCFLGQPLVAKKLLSTCAHNNLSITLICLSDSPNYIFFLPNVCEVIVIFHVTKLPKKKLKKNYEVLRICQDTWALAFPWANMQ